MAGRKKKYTAKSLRERIENYFAAYSRTVFAKERYDTGERDSDGHKIYAEQIILNDAGIPISYTEFVIPPTIGGLCGHLGISRQTWSEYCDQEKHPEFHEATTWARGRIQAYLETALLTRKDVKGVIFNLQNNYGYSEKHQIDYGPHTAKAVMASSMTMAEKQELLKEIAREWGEDTPSDAEAQDPLPPQPPEGDSSPKGEPGEE